MKREQLADTPAGEGPIAGREIGALRTALRFQPPAGDFQLDRLERLRPHALASAVRADHDPAWGFEPVPLVLLGP